MTDISILSFDVSHNCLGRAHMLAEILSRRFQVEIVGPATSEEGIWLPCRESEVPISWTPQGRIVGVRMVRRLLSMVHGRMIYAVKPRFSSYGVGLMARRFRSVPLVVDVDDWELGFYLENMRGTVRFDIANRGNLNNLATTWLMEKLVGRADAITISSDYLKRRFGGVRISHARDTAAMDPAGYNRDRIRAERGWEGNTVAIFLGTPAVHKGIDTLIAAAGMVTTPGFKVVIAGAGPGSEVMNGEPLPAGVDIEVMGQVPFSSIPELLAAADIAVMPQHMGPATAGQVPAKLVDAMAMGKAIVASAVSDIPEMIEGCGLVCEPGSITDLAAKMSLLAVDAGLRSELGARARIKCVANYSYDALEEPLCSIFEAVSNTGRVAA